MIINQNINITQEYNKTMIIKTDRHICRLFLIMLIFIIIIKIFSDMYLWESRNG